MDGQTTVHPKEWEKVKAPFQRMLSQGRVEVEVLGVRKDDTVFWKTTIRDWFRMASPPSAQDPSEGSQL